MFGETNQQKYSFKKICLFIPNLNGGGAERVFVNLSRIFMGYGFSVDLVVGSKTGSLACKVEDINVIDLASNGVLKSIIPLMKYLTAKKPDIILSAMSHANLAAIIAHKLSSSKCKIICTVHEDAFSVMEHISKHDKLVLRLMKFGYGFVNGIIAVSQGLLESQRKFYKASLPTNQVSIYNPIIPNSSNIIKQRVSKKSWSSNSPFKIVSAGRLNNQKDFDTLIKAFSKLPDYKNTRLTIYGEGPERENLLKLIKILELEEYVSLPGFTNDINTVFLHSDLFVLTSIWEGFGNVIVEAMAAGCPVIATNCKSGPSEILDNGRYGYLVPVKDVQEIAKSIVLVQNGNLIHFNTQQALQRFLFENVGLHYLNFFEKCYN